MCYLDILPLLLLGYFKNLEIISLVGITLLSAASTFWPLYVGNTQKSEPILAVQGGLNQPRLLCIMYLADTFVTGAPPGTETSSVAFLV